MRDLLTASVNTSELDEAIETYTNQVSEAVSSDAETAAYVEELEERVDAVDEEEDIPSGETLAAELTRYLRERESGNDEPGPRPH